MMPQVEVSRRKTLCCNVTFIINFTTEKYTNNLPKKKLLKFYKLKFYQNSIIFSNKSIINIYEPLPIN